MAERRRIARETALQVLYLLDGNPELSAAEALARFWELGRGPDGERLLGPDDESRFFAERLLRGVVEHRAALDEMIRRHSRNWRLERMSIVDRNVLRLAAYELTECDDIPAGVSLNEAVELAKRFGTAESSAFVNGILDRIAAEARRA